MRRRELLHLALLLSGASACGAAARTVLGELPAPAAARAALTASERAMIATLAELVIPATDTPGAIEANVPAFIEAVVTQWYDARERRIFRRGLEALDEGCRRGPGRPFLECSPELQAAALRGSEERALEGGARGGGADGDAPFFLKLKELTVVGYYTSEIGATRELRYDPVPLKYDGDLSFESVGRQWSR